MKSCIYKVPIFQGLPQQHVNRLQQSMVHRQLAAGEVCVWAGERVDRLYVVHQGCLRFMYTAPNGKEQLIRELRPGEFYGEISLLTDVISEGDLVAAVATEACVLERSAVQAVLRGVPAVSLSLVQTLAVRLFQAERAFGELALFDVAQRLAVALLRQGAIANGLPALGGEALLYGSICFDMPCSWAELATRLATTPESLSRRLAAFAKAGLIEVDGRRVHILDVDKMRQMLFD